VVNLTCSLYRKEAHRACSCRSLEWHCCAQVLTHFTAVNDV